MANGEITAVEDDELDHFGLCEILSTRVNYLRGCHVCRHAEHGMLILWVLGGCAVFRLFNVQRPEEVRMTGVKLTLDNPTRSTGLEVGMMARCTGTSHAVIGGTKQAFTPQNFQ